MSELLDTWIFSSCLALVGWYVHALYKEKKLKRGKEGK